MGESWLLFVMVQAATTNYSLGLESALLGSTVCCRESVGKICLWFPSKDWFWIMIIFAFTLLCVPSTWMTENIFFFCVTPCLQHHPEWWSEQQNHLALRKAAEKFFFKCLQCMLHPICSADTTVKCRWWHILFRHSTVHTIFTSYVSLPRERAAACPISLPRGLVYLPGCLTLCLSRMVWILHSTWACACSIQKLIYRER